MLSRQVITRFSIIVLVSVFIISGQTSFAQQDEAPEFKGVGVNFGPSNNSFGLLSADPSNFGVNMESVNLYTGQHMESFALESVSGRGGLGVSLALEYNGNVHEQARKENRKSQASPFGLGFNLSMPSIVVDHAGTADIYDDKYKLIVNNTAFDLRKVPSSDSSFITQNDQPWRIYRHLDTVSSWETITGWTIKREDGTVYKFGDFADTLGGWNATRNILRYGNFVGSGVAVGDTIYPHQWDLKRIEDVEGLNWVEITYLHDSAYLQVQNNSGTAIVNSDNPYTRASYISEIETSDGKKLAFKYASRYDFQTLNDVNRFEFYFTKRIFEIKSIGKDGNQLSLTRFNFQISHQAMYYPEPFDKLLLTSIKRYASDASESLPEISFNYYSDKSDPRYLRIKSISYPNGAVKEIHYDTLASVDNFSKLDLQVTDSIPTDYQSYFENNFNFLQKDNIFMLRLDDTVQLGYWDGYWKVDTFTAQMNSRDLPAISSAGYAFIPEGNSSIIIKKWESGYWKTDTLSGAFTRYDTGYVYLYSGMDCFLIVTGGYDTAEKSKGMRRAYYCWWNEQNWQVKLIAEQPEKEKHWFSASVGYNTFAISAKYKDTCGGNPKIWFSYLYYGIWDRENDSIVIDSVLPNCSGYALDNSYLVGTDFISFAGYHNILCRRWTGTDWVESPFLFGTERIVRALSPLSNGLCYAVVDEGSSVLKLGQIDRVSGGFRQTNTDFTGGQYAIPKPGRLWGSSNSLICQFEGLSTITLSSWTGLGYDFNHYVNGTSDTTYTKSVFLYDDFWSYGPSSYPHQVPENNNLFSNVYLGNAEWSTKQKATNSALMGVAASNWFSVFRVEDSSYISMLHPFYYTDDFKVRKVHAVPHPADSIEILASRHLASSNSFGIEYMYRIEIDTQENDYFCDNYVFKLYDTLFTGKPPILVVDSVVVRENSNDQNPILKTYDYFGALLDESANTPRFARTRVSTPYYLNDSTPIGYTVSLFYNDIDDSSFYDTSIYSSGISFPDLDDSTLYGIYKGGFELDGHSYLTYSFTYGDSGKFDDSVRYFYSLIPNDSVFDVNRVLLDSTYAYKDSIFSSKHFTYDRRNWRIIESKTPHKDDSSFIIDSIVYAYNDTTLGMEDDNAVIQVSKTMRVYDSPDSTILLSIDSTDYALKGSWKQVRRYVFPDLSDLDSVLIVSDTLSGGKSFDSFGNFVANANLAGIVSGSILSPDGTYPIATYSNANPEEIEIFDAEDGFEHTNWHNLDTNTVHITNSLNFTGHYSVKCDSTASGWHDVLSLRLLGENLTSDLFYVSLWTKAEHTSQIAIQIFDGLDTCSANGAASTPGLNEWEQIHQLIDLTNCNNIDSINIVIKEYNTTAANVTYFDDIRFHPIDAAVTTATYDSSFGLVLSESGGNNFPIKYQYDNLQRLVNTYDYQNRILKRREYQFSKKKNEYYPFGTYALSSPRFGDSYVDSYRGIKTGSVILTHSQEVNCHLELVSCGLTIEDTSWVKIYNNDTLVFKFVDSCDTWWYEPLDTNSSFYALAGDEVTIEVFCDTSRFDLNPESNAGMYASAYVGYGVSFDVEYQSDNPNYVKSTTFSLDSSEIETVTFFNGLGKKIQTRTTTFDTSKTEVLGWENDVFGRQTKIYKPFLDDTHSIGYDTTVRFDTAWQICEWGYLANHDRWTGDSAKVDSAVFTMSSPARIIYAFDFMKNIGDSDGIYLYVNETLVDSMVDCWECSPTSTTNWELCPYTIEIVEDTIEVDSGDVIKFVSDNNNTDFHTDCDSIETYADAIWLVGCIDAIDTSIFVDTVIVNGVTDYDNDSSIQALAIAYYDSTGPGPDCEGYPYSASVYESDIKGRKIEQALPGLFYSLDDSNTTTFDYETDTANQLYVSTVTDPDGISKSTLTDHWGLTNKTISTFEGLSGTDTVITISSTDIKGTFESVAIDTGGGQPITLRQNWYNDLGQQDSTWKVDYGTIRMIYDYTGNLRFMQNDKRKDEHRFVYFKYDHIGRKIEEGWVGDDSLYFSQLYADSTDFPETAHSPLVFYRYYYDKYDSIVAPGQLVRVQNADSSYYKEFYYFPEDDSDFVIVNLPQAGDNLKKIKHEYNWDGTLKYLTVWPSYPGHFRRTKYSYNKLGQLASISDGDLFLFGVDSANYAEYNYNAEGAFEKVLYGVTYYNFPSSVDTIQKIDYIYNTLGALVGINDPEEVIDTIAYGVDSGNDNDHFGMTIRYYDPDSARYANGRVHSINSVNSATDDTKDYYYEYLYNDLGWLTYAIDTLNASNNREFQYNAFGNRTRTIFASDTVDYEYYTTDSGSSMLARTSDMPAGDSLYYDVLGNLVADTANERYLMAFEYRNLMSYARLNRNLGPTQPHTLLHMSYDENEQRIYKKYTYYVWDSCYGGGGQGLGPMGPGGGGEDTCAGQEETITTYLYDNDGTLLATFNQDDNVIDMFINGPDGIVASFYQNSDTKLHHYFNDHLGSTRLTMTGPPLGGNAKVTAWYNYHPFGSLNESYESYSTPFRFTSKELDDESSFGLYYFGARYYSSSLGTFSSIDKAGQFASGYVYGINNPVSGIDSDGNLFFLSVPFIMGAILGGSSYAMTTDNFRLDQFLGYAAFGGIASYASAAVAPHSAILASGTGSSINSLGGSIISGNDFSINFGFGTLGSNGFNLTDPRSITGALGWLTAAEDLNKLLTSSSNGTFDAVKDRQTREGGPRQIKIDKETGEPIKEADIRNADKKAIIKTTQKKRPDVDWEFSLDDGTSTTSPAGGHSNGQLRLSSGFDGGLHVDPREIGGHVQNIWHSDFFPSGITSNPGTFIQHVAFESVPHDLGKWLGSRLPLSAAVYQRILYTPSYVYRNHYLY